MKFTQVFALASALGALVAAAPTAEPQETQVAEYPYPNNNETETLQKRSLSFTYWVDANFQGTFGQTTNPGSGQCYFVGSSLNDKVSSVGPDKGLRCTIFQDANCRGNAISNIQYPGIQNLQGSNFNDKMSSFFCYYG